MYVITLGLHIGSNMKHLLIITSLLFIGCAIDTGSSAYVNDITQPKSSSNYNTLEFGYSSSSNIQSFEPHYFPRDFEYVGIFKTSHGANLVMKNNTASTMSVKVNYTIACSVNGNPAETTSQTLSFSLDMFEQKESSNSVDGYWHGGMKTIECNGYITSVIPTSYDHSNFQIWTGVFPIATN